MSFTPRSTLASALPDRLVLYIETDRFLNKAMSMLEPLLLGYLASTAATLEQSACDFGLLRRALTLLDSSLPASQTLLAKLESLKFHHSAHFLLSNSSQQSEDKLRVARALGNSELVMEILTGSASSTDLIIHRLRNEQDYRREREAIAEQMGIFRAQGEYEYAYMCAELLCDSRAALELAELIGCLGELKERIESSGFNNIENADLCYFMQARDLKLKMSKAKRYGIPEERFQPWGLPLKSNKGVVKGLSAAAAADRELENLNRLNLGYDEAPFSTVVNLREDAFKPRFMHSVESTNLANWIGIDSLIESDHQSVSLAEPVLDK
jgi:hypothetical protein